MQACVGRESFADLAVLSAEASEHRPCYTSNSIPVISEALMPMCLYQGTVCSWLLLIWI